MRLLGITIPDNKCINIALRSIYGIGPSRASQIVKELKISPDKRTKQLTTEQANNIKEYITKQYKVEGELRQSVRTDITRLKNIKSYRGDRHSRRLPVHGQRTKTNSRTVRGNVRKTAGSGRRKVELK